MVVVPAFSAGEQGYPPYISAAVPGIEKSIAVSFHVADRVDELGSPEHHEGSDNASCECYRSADDVDEGSEKYIESEAEFCLVCGVVDSEFAQPFVFQKIRNLLSELFGRLPIFHGEHPAVERVLETTDRAVRIVVGIGFLVMKSVNPDPVDRSTHEAEISTGDDEIFQPVGHSQRFMGEESVVAEGDAHAEVREEYEKP